MFKNLLDQKIIPQMKTKYLFTSFVVILSLVLTLSLSLVSAFSGLGAGTQNNPYQITNCTQLQEMQDDLAGNYVLMNNVDCSDTVNWNGGAGGGSVGGSFAPLE